MNEELEKELLTLQKKFDIDEYGTVNENGFYLIGQVKALIQAEVAKGRIDEKVKVLKKILSYDIVYEQYKLTIEKQLAELTKEQL